jgi:hypothetical protein
MSGQKQLLPFDADARGICPHSAVRKKSIVSQELWSPASGVEIVAARPEIRMAADGSTRPETLRKAFLHACFLAPAK